MTRREFMMHVAGAVSVAGTGRGWIERKTMPYRATRLGKYPGKVVPMEDIRRQSKWSG